MRFTKMHGIGNDFVLINGFTEKLPADLGTLSKRICDRHFGIGADGLIVMVPTDVADVRMRIFNSDGSEPEMCGNGLRCAALFARTEGICEKDTFTVDTLAGILTCVLNGNDVTVDMGMPILDAAKIPVASQSNIVTIDTPQGALTFFCVSMGNPHAVTFDLYPDDPTFHVLGPWLESHPMFPAKANIEFARLREGGIDVHVWERGDGETLACGTGACAVLTAAFEQKLCGDHSDIRLPGGTLNIRLREDRHLIMRGPAEAVFTGDWPC